MLCLALDAELKLENVFLCIMDSVDLIVSITCLLSSSDRSDCFWVFRNIPVRHLDLLVSVLFGDIFCFFRFWGGFVRDFLFLFFSPPVLFSPADGELASLTTWNVILWYSSAIELENFFLHFSHSCWSWASSLLPARILIQIFSVSTWETFEHFSVSPRKFFWHCLRCASKINAWIHCPSRNHWRSQRTLIDWISWLQPGLHLGLHSLFLHF